MSLLGPDTLRRIEIRFPLTFSAVASLVLIALVIWYWREPASSTRDTLLFFVIGATAVGQITASFYTARVLGATLRRDARDADFANRADIREKARLIHELKVQAVKFGERWNHPEMNVARDAFRGIMRHRDRPEEELLRFIESNETSVTHVINFLEEMATCCRHELVDVELMKSQFDNVIIHVWETLFPWIRKIRQRENAPVWEDIEFLYDHWKRS